MIMEIVMGMTLRGLDVADPAAVAAYCAAIQQEHEVALAEVAAHQESRRPSYPQSPCYGWHWRDDD